MGFRDRSGFASRGRGRAVLVGAPRPVDEVEEAAVEGNLWLPPQVLLHLCDVADVVGLVALAPVGEGVFGLGVRELADLVDDLEKVPLVRRTATDVVHLAPRLFD